MRQKILKIPPKYRLTKKISSHLANIEACRQVINVISIPVEVEENFRRKSIFGSSLFSARIEGNTLTMATVSGLEDLSGKDQEKIEVANIHRAITHILTTIKPGHEYSIGDILKWHALLTNRILGKSYSGRWRVKHEGLFDRSGNLLHHFPPPGMMSVLTKDLVRFVNSRREKIIPIRAILAHLTLEKIHPFVDANGRVGRLLQLAVLHSGGYGMKGLVSIEEGIEKNRITYYDTIESASNSDATDFVEFILELIDHTASQVRDNLLAKKDFRHEDQLLPRRQEILTIIREQRVVSLDFLHRRFLKIDPRVLRKDLEALMKDNYIQKIGKTKGALYTIKQ